MFRVRVGGESDWPTGIQCILSATASAKLSLLLLQDFHILSLVIRLQNISGQIYILPRITGIAHFYNENVALLLTKLKEKRYYFIRNFIRITRTIRTICTICRCSNFSFIKVLNFLLVAPLPINMNIIVLIASMRLKIYEYTLLNSRVVAIYFDFKMKNWALTLGYYSWHHFQVHFLQQHPGF